VNKLHYDVRRLHILRFYYSRNSPSPLSRQKFCRPGSTKPAFDFNNGNVYQHLGGAPSRFLVTGK